MTTRSFDLACLDMAGTTVDEGGLVYDVLDSVVSDAVGADIAPDLLAQWKGTSKRDAIAGLMAGLGADPSGERVDEVFENFNAELAATYRATPPTPIDGVPEALAELRRRGIRLALQTGYSAPIAQALLAGLGWTVGEGAGDTVEAMVTSDQVRASRPAPFLIFHCMEATDCRDVRRVLVVGDTPNDLGAGTNAGAGLVVGVLTGSFGRAELESHPHTHVLESVVGIVDL